MTKSFYLWKARNVLSFEYLLDFQNKIYFLNLERVVKSIICFSFSFVQNFATPRISVNALMILWKKCILIPTSYIEKFGYRCLIFVVKTFFLLFNWAHLFKKRCKCFSERFLYCIGYDKKIVETCQTKMKTFWLKISYKKVFFTPISNFYWCLYSNYL